MSSGWLHGDPDGSLRRFVTIWFVRLGDDLYVRSAYGYDNPWFQRALASGDGRIRVGGMERDVTFVAPGRRSRTISTRHTTPSTTVTGRASSGRSCRRRRCGRRSRWFRADVVRRRRREVVGHISAGRRVSVMTDSAQGS